jgi:hypothetical protein
MLWFKRLSTLQAEFAKLELRRNHQLQKGQIGLLDGVSTAANGAATVRPQPRHWLVYSQGLKSTRSRPFAVVVAKGRLGSGGLKTPPTVPVNFSIQKSHLPSTACVSYLGDAVSNQKSRIADLEIAALRRRDRREQPTIGFEIKQRCAV